MKYVLIQLSIALLLSALLTLPADLIFAQNNTSSVNDNSVGLQDHKSQSTIIIIHFQLQELISNITLTMVLGYLIGFSVRGLI